MTKTYTVTGGTGYIGSQLLEHLSKDKSNTIFAVIREGSEIKVRATNIEYIIYNGTEMSVMKAIKESDYLVHLAALYDTRTDEKTTKDLIESNIGFSTLLFNVCNNYNKDIVISSTSTFSALSEEGAYAPSSLYAATKVAVESIAKVYSDLSVHFLTLPDTYGPGDWRNKIHNILKRNKNWPFEFKSPSSQIMSLMHVQDVIAHILSSMEDNSKGVHIHDIYANGEYLNLEQLADKITKNKFSFNEDGEIVKIPTLERDESEPTGYRRKYIFSVDLLK